MTFNWEIPHAGKFVCKLSNGGAQIDAQPGAGGFIARVWDNDGDPASQLPVRFSTLEQAKQVIERRFEYLLPIKRAHGDGRPQMAGFDW
jgi:hypothetical protein